MFVYLGLLQLACLPVGPTNAEGGWLYLLFVVRSCECVVFCVAVCMICCLIGWLIVMCCRLRVMFCLASIIIIIIVI